MATLQENIKKIRSGLKRAFKKFGKGTASIAEAILKPPKLAPKGATPQEIAREQFKFNQPQWLDDFWIKYNADDLSGAKRSLLKGIEINPNSRQAKDMRTMVKVLDDEFETLSGGEKLTIQGGAFANAVEKEFQKLSGKRPADILTEGLR